MREANFEEGVSLKEAEQKLRSKEKVTKSLCLCGAMKTPSANELREKCTQEQKAFVNKRFVNEIRLKRLTGGNSEKQTIAPPAELLNIK